MRENLMRENERKMYILFLNEISSEVIQQSNFQLKMHVVHVHIVLLGVFIAPSGWEFPSGFNCDVISFCLLCKN